MGTDMNEWMRMKFVSRRKVAVAVNVVRQVVESHGRDHSRDHGRIMASWLRHVNVTVLPASIFLEARKGL